jgi:tRNA-splicing ligase RtcB
MFVMYEKDAMRLPVKVWLEDKKDLEETCREQAYHLAQLPFLHK